MTVANAFQPPPGVSFGGTAPSAPIGVTVPVTIPLYQAGVEVTVNLQFGPEYAQPQALQQLLMQLKAAGWPVREYQIRQGGFDRGGNDYRGDRGGWRGRRGRW